MLTLSPEQTVREAARRFAERQSQAFPVVDKSGTLVGVISCWQILHQALPPYVASGELRDVRYAPDLSQFHEHLGALKNRPIAALMDANPPIVQAHDSVLECAALLLQTTHHMPLVFVVDSPRRLLGVIGVLDLLKEIR